MSTTFPEITGLTRAVVVPAPAELISKTGGLITS